jgi:integrase
MPNGLYKPKNSPNWHYDFVVDGARFCRSTRTKSKPEAKKIYDAVRAEAVRAAAVGGQYRARKTMTLREAAGRYWEEHGRHAKSKDSFVWPRLSAIVAGLGADTLLHEIGNDRVAAFVAARRSTVPGGRSRPVEPATINLDLTVLRTVMLRARDHWDVDVGRVPNWKKHRLPEAAERRRDLNQDEEVALLEHLPPELASMMVFSLITGVRLASATRLCWEDVHADHIAFKDVKSARVGEQHAVPLTPELRLLLAELRGQHPSLVFTYTCRRSERRPGRPERVQGQRYPFSKDNWRKAWAKALAAAGVCDLRWHDLRHTAATRLLRATGNLALAQALLGHATIATTRRYAHTCTADLEAGMRAASRAFPGSGTARGGALAVSDLSSRTYDDEKCSG